MKGRELLVGSAAALLWSAPLLAQERDPSLARISLALQQPPAIMQGRAAPDTSLPTSLGPFTLVPPTSRGEIVRVSVPIGDIVTRAFKGVAAARQRRKELAARREVEAELKSFLEQQQKDPKP